MTVCMSGRPLMIVFGADRARITEAEAEREDWPRVFVRAGCVAALSADRRFWELLSEGPVVALFEDHREGHAVLEAYTEARRRRLH
jgi:hypothetical protein